MPAPETLFSLVCTLAPYKEVFHFPSCWVLCFKKGSWARFILLKMSWRCRKGDEGINNDGHYKNTQKQNYRPKRDALARAAAARSFRFQTKVAMKLRWDREGLSLANPVQSWWDSTFAAHGLVDVPVHQPWLSLVATFSSDLTTDTGSSPSNLPKNHRLYLRQCA